MTVKRMDNVGIVMEDIDAAVEFFTELGLTLEGRMPIDGEWAGRVTGVRGQRVEIAMMRTPDGHSRIELSRFHAPAIASDHRTAPVNSLGYLRVMFAVEDIDDTLARLSKFGATVVDEVVDYRDIYRLCYIRGPKEFSSGLPNSSGSRRQGSTGVEDSSIGAEPRVAATVRCPPCCLRPYEVLRHRRRTSARKLCLSARMIRTTAGGASVCSKRADQMTSSTRTGARSMPLADRR
jgi:catechol 2,3-dioxygenase-like lactoylglutathione lyase family enzyme